MSNKHQQWYSVEISNNMKSFKRKLDDDHNQKLDDLWLKTEKKKNISLKFFIFFSGFTSMNLYQLITLSICLEFYRQHDRNFKG